MSYWICTECGAIYDSKSFNSQHLNRNPTQCPKVNCSGALFECNELLIPTVLELSRKGYDIRGGCVGHSVGNGCGFVVFGDYMYELTLNLPKPPNGWIWDNYQLRDNTTYRTRTLLSVNDGKDMREKQIILTENANSLMNWAYNLEPLNHED